LLREDDRIMSSALRSDANLPDALVARARAASDGRLALDVVCGLFVALAVIAWHPRLWLIPFSAAICFAAYGGWGIADRELRERSDVAGALAIMTLRIVRSLAAAAGVIATATALFAVLAIALGNWIS
jgi:hypothetical protein